MYRNNRAYSDKPQYESYSIQISFTVSTFNPKSPLTTKLFFINSFRSRRRSVSVNQLNGGQNWVYFIWIEQTIENKTDNNLIPLCMKTKNVKKKIEVVLFSLID